MQLIPLLQEISQCTVCEAHLPFPPRPVVQANTQARLLIIGQAPGLKVQQSGIPWNDASGKRLREWLQMDEQQFYDPAQVAIMPMGFCYPGKGKSGDLPPRKECAPKWHAQLLALLPNIHTTLLIGQYAQKHYLKGSDFLKQYPSLTERVRNTHNAPNNIICLPHPSPRNQIWLKKHPWFNQDILTYLQKRLG
jgi:uracil-DNA glycosylase family 4